MASAAKAAKARFSVKINASTPRLQCMDRQRLQILPIEGARVLTAALTQATKAIEAVFRDETGAYLGDLFEQRLALNSRDAKALVAALKKWLVLKVACDDFDATILSPPKLIDEAWQRPAW